MTRSGADGSRGLALLAVATAAVIFFAVAAPLLGGLAWHHSGDRVIFLAGSAVALASLGVAQGVPPGRAPAPERVPAAPLPAGGPGT